MMGWAYCSGILQALGLHFLAEQFGEREACPEVRIVAGDEDGITAEAVAEMALLALEFPILEERVGHGVMVDRQEQIRRQIVGGGDTPDEAGLALPSVRSNLVSAKPSAFNFSSIRCARRRLKTNSATLRALIAPSDWRYVPHPERSGISRDRTLARLASKRKGSNRPSPARQLLQCGALATRHASPGWPALARRRALTICLF